MWLNVTDKDFLKICRALNAAGDDSSRLTHEILLWKEGQRKLAKYRRAAKKFQKDGEIEIDRDAIVSKGADAGAYVMAWMWVPEKEAKIR